MGQGVISVNKNGFIELINPAAGKLLGIEGLSNGDFLMKRS